MLANIANTILGIWLVYTAVLNSSLMGTPFRYVAVIAGIVIIVLSLVARRTDYHPWHSNVTMTLGLSLIIVGIWNFASPLALVVNYWFTFWVGVLVAFIALWAGVYRPAPGGPRLT